MTEEKVTLFYPARVNTESGEVTYLNRDRHNELYSARRTKDEVQGFEDFEKVQKIIDFKNTENEEFGGRYEYFAERVDETREKMTEGLSEAAKKWFTETPTQE